MSDAFLVEVTRGPIVESRHRVSAAIVDARGKVVASWGDIARPVYPRSANKPLQALALVETGAADRFGLGDTELALSCASHMGEPRHTETVAAWLQRIGLGPDDLECGAHLPYHEPTAAAMIRAGEAPSGIHNNCSGKHTGFLTTAVHMGEPTKGYIGRDHPVQRRIAAIQSAMCGVDFAAAPTGVDGCGIPTIGIPLSALARGMANLADPVGQPAERAGAARRIVAAMAADPFMVSGTDHFPTVFMTVAGAKAVTKSGAEGVYTAALRSQGLGLALKVEDGTGRGAELAAAALLEKLAGLDAEETARLQSFLHPEIRNRAGLVVGGLRAATAVPF